MIGLSGLGKAEAKRDIKELHLVPTVCVSLQTIYQFHAKSGNISHF